MGQTPFQNNNPKRQKLIRPLPGSSEAMKAGEGQLEMTESDVKKYIRDLSHLQECLRIAIQLELSTIPPYLCALYTINEGSSTEASMLIRSIVMEEMLHMVMVCNILNAITPVKKGDKSKLFDVKKIIPSYPTALPGNIVPLENPKFKVSLRKFSPEAIDEFITIEEPANPDAVMTNAKTFDSIGQFYQAIRYGLDRLNRKTKGGIFKGDPARQITGEQYYGSGGKIVKVENYEDANAAIEEIVGQGEGIDGTIATEVPLFGENIEYAHYFKFLEIKYGRMFSANDTNFQMPLKSIPTGKPFSVSWTAVHNMKENPKMKDYKNDPELLALATDFNKVYVRLLTSICDAVSGDPAELSKGIALMYELKYKALALMNIPLGNGQYAGPTFEYVEL